MSLTIEEIKNRIKQVSLSHEDIESFDFGESFDVANFKNATYPMCFLELPYLLTYLDDRRFKTIQLAINFLGRGDFEKDREYTNEVISNMELIGDAVITKLEQEYTDFKFDSVNAVSLRDFSDDSLSGVRYEVIIRTQRAFCTKRSYNSKFTK
jgi:uncharacterized protein with HEPN domain